MAARTCSPARRTRALASCASSRARTARGLRTLAGEAAGDAFGGEFARLGDLDGDGRPELAVAAARRDLAEGGTDAGRVYVKSGRDGSTLAALDGERAGDLFGSALAAALENGEPFLVVGAQDAGPARGGRVYAFRGRALEPAFAIEGDATAVNYGRFFLSIPGDLDGDGALDVYSCDFENTARGPATGRAYVHSGRDGSLIYEWTGAASGEGFGIGNALAGDQNGDGVPDLAIGAWLNSQAAPQAGKLYVFSGKDGALLRRITGAHAGAQLGFDATGLADLDGDGRAELLVTAAGYAGQTGATYVISSRARTARASEAGSSGE